MQRSKGYPRTFTALQCVISYSFGFLTAYNLLNPLSPERNDEVVALTTTVKVEDDATAKKNKKDAGLILPFERNELKSYLSIKGQQKLTDAYTYFLNYMNLFAVTQDHSPKDFTTLPLLHIWPIYFEVRRCRLHRN